VEVLGSSHVRTKNRFVKLSCSAIDFQSDKHGADSAQNQIAAIFVSCAPERRGAMTPGGALFAPSIKRLV
jgi:hypothetical protein